MRIAGRVVTDYVAQHYGLTFTQIISENRRWQIARPRQVAMYVMREVCPHLSYPAIGRLKGLAELRGVELALSRRGARA